MKSLYLVARGNPNRPRSTVTLSLPNDMIADMEQIAARFACSEANSLMRVFIIMGLRESLEFLNKTGSGVTPYAAATPVIHRILRAVAENSLLNDAEKRFSAVLPVE